MPLFLQLARFGVIGIISTVIHLGTALALRELTSLAPLAANLGGFVCAVMFSYFGHAKLTFRQGAWQGEQFTRFAITALSALSVSSLITWWMTDRMGASFALAMLLVGAVVPVVNFIVLKLWVFENRPSSKQPDLAGPLTALAICAVLLTLLWGQMINHDTAWYLLATREWLSGFPLYDEISEVNPPLNFYYTVPALWIADALSISDKNAQYLLITALIFVILTWCQKILRSACNLGPAKTALITLILAAGLIIPSLRDFAQREQLFVLLLMPWLTGLATHQTTELCQEIGRSFVAALGVCLKPHFVLIPIGLTLLQIYQKRSLRPIFSPSNLTYLVVGLAYVAYVAIQHPTYLTTIAPMARDIYGAYRIEGWIVVVFALPALVCGLLLSIATLREKPVNQAILVFLVAATGALAIFGVQGTGFRYHLIPVYSFLLVACGFALFFNRWRSLIFWVALVTSLTLGVHLAKRGLYFYDAAEEVMAVARTTGKVEHLMVLSGGVGLGAGPALELNAKWSSHYSSNWLVPGSLNRLAKTDCTVEPDLCAKLERYLALNRTANIKDIQRTSPELIVLERINKLIEDKSFTWHTYLSEDPAWPEILKNYETYRTTEQALYLRRLSP